MHWDDVSKPWREMVVSARPLRKVGAQCSSASMAREPMPGRGARLLDDRSDVHSARTFLNGRPEATGAGGLTGHACGVTTLQPIEDSAVARWNSMLE
jgi:hypothetical protein